MEERTKTPLARGLSLEGGLPFGGAYESSG